jgi:regulator of RNase E activity RraA
MPDSVSLVHRLGRLDCCAVSDALDKLRLSGQVTSLSRQSGSGRIAGRAVTVLLGVGDPSPGQPRHLGTTAIELSDEETIIVVEQRTSIEAGCWGGLLTLGAKVKGVRGVIADGPVRDIDEARDLAFPIFTNRTTCLTARGRVVEKATNVPVNIGEVHVSPGDYVVADDSAVLFIPEGYIERVLQAAELIVAREAAMARAIISGTPIHDVMGGNYEQMLTE